MRSSGSREFVFDSSTSQQVSEPPSRTGRPWHAGREPWIILAAALLIRLIFLLMQARADPVLFVPIIDERTYVDDARQWIESGFRISGLKLPFWQPPGYMLLLAGWMGFGGTPTGFAFLQLMLGVASSLLLYHVILRAFGGPAKRWAFIAGLLYGACPSILYYETKLLKPTVAIFLMLALLALSFPREHSGRWFTRGLICGVLTLLEVYFLAWPFLLAYAGRGNRRGLVRLALGLTLIAGPIFALNVQRAGFQAGLAYNGPINLFIGNNPDWLTTYNTLPGWTWDQILQRGSNAAGDNHIANHGRVFTGSVLSFLRDNPAAFAAGWAGKALLFCSASDLPRDGAMMMQPLLGVLALATDWTMIFLVALAAPRIRREPLVWIPLSLILLVNVVFFPTSRYRLPAWPLALLAAGALSIGPPPRWKHSVALGALALVLFATITARRWIRHDDWLAFTWNEAAWSNLDRNRGSQARTCIQTALAYARLPAALNTAGQIAAAEDQDLLGAWRLFNEATETEPRFPDSYFNRGRVEALMGRKNDAYRSYDLFLDRVNPELPGLTENNARSILQALEFNAHCDFEQQRLPAALARLLRMRAFLIRRNTNPTSISGLDQQIEQLQNRLSVAPLSAISRRDETTGV